MFFSHPVPDPYAKNWIPEMWVSISLKAFLGSTLNSYDSTSSFVLTVPSRPLTVVGSSSSATKLSKLDGTLGWIVVVCPRQHPRKAKTMENYVSKQANCVVVLILVMQCYQDSRFTYQYKIVSLNRRFIWLNSIEEDYQNICLNSLIWGRKPSFR